MDKGAQLYRQFRRQGYDFFVGVPCSGLKGFIQRIIDEPEMVYCPAVREDVAMGMAVGAYLAGKKPLVYLQNSGLGHLVNIITSCLKPYQISIHLLISVRSKPFEHTFMYKITQQLLELLEYRDYTLLIPEKEE